MKDVILVLGMGRCGTSALTRILSLSGCLLPKDLLGANSSNETGHWEPLRALEINDRILSSFGSNWWEPTLRVESTLLEDRHMRRVQRCAFTDEIIHFLEGCPSEGTVVIKDPRITAVADCWFDAIKHLDGTIKVIIPVRSPTAVTASLAKRDALPVELSSGMWLKYNVQAVMKAKAFSHVFVNYDDLMSDWRHQISRISSQLGVDLNTERAHEIDAFLRRDLQHHVSDDQPVEVFGGTWIGTLYSALLEASRDISSPDEVIHKTYSALLDGRLCMKTAVRQWDAFNIRLQRDQLQREVAHLQRALEESQAHLSHTETELRRQAEATSMLESARDEAASMLESARDEISYLKNEASSLHSRLAVSVQECNDQQARLTAMQASTMWRTGEGLRMISRRLPPPVRQFLMQSIRFGLRWGWRIARRIAVGRQAVAQTATAPNAYKRWMRDYDTLSNANRGAIAKHIQRLPWRPLISVVMPVYETNERLLREAIASVRTQLYPHWELCIADDASPSPHIARILTEAAAQDARIKWVRRETNGHVCVSTNMALDLATGEFIALMDHDDLLAENALYEVAVELNGHPKTDMLYSDEDHVDMQGRRKTPYFKTDWNPDLILGHNFVSHLGVYRRTLVKQLGGFREGYEGAQDYDLTLRVADATTPDRIRHVPSVLYHWRRNVENGTFSERQSERCAAASRLAVADHLARRGEKADVVPHPLIPNWQRVVRPLPSPQPLVSLIIPTRDKADLLRACVQGILRRTNYEPLEVIIVDHESREPETLTLFKYLAQDPRVRIIPYQGPFNYSDINNFAIAQAKGSIIGLINNDVAVIGPDWLGEMVSLAVLPGVGAVGAKLLYPDNLVQHAGVVLGPGGVAHHFHHKLGRHEVGYFGRAMLVSSVSAVTGACLVLRKAVFDEVGGLDAANLPVAFNDVDLCLRIRDRGYRNVFTPHAELYHFESASRGSDMRPERIEGFKSECNYMRQRWGKLLDCDPFYNLNFSLDGDVFALAHPPRREKPWREKLGYTTTTTAQSALARSYSALTASSPCRNEVPI